jgi:hypothetical protein
MYELYKSVCTDCYIMRYKLWVRKKVHYKLVSERGFDTEPTWASGTVFGPRMRGEIELGGPISDPGFLRRIKETLDEFY